MRVQSRESRVQSVVLSPSSAQGVAQCPNSPPARDPRLSTLDPSPAGFTLVEMLVSVALVVLMMSMFATIFQQMTSATGKHRGIAENDQRARSVITVLRADLDKRTFRNLIPYRHLELPTDEPPIPFSNRKGYFYISENDPDDDSDDVLQFTVDAKISFGNSDKSPYYGRALSLGNLLTNPNQPEADDGQIDPDGTSVSVAAEISYFLRGGRLYRRVLLIRKPLSLPEITSDQPKDQAGNSYFDGIYMGNFWRDFDFSAYYDDSVPGAKFNGIGSLDNGSGTGTTPLANPRNRFGHDHDEGQPREFVDSPGPDGIFGTADDVNQGAFLGRFTHEETSFHIDDGDDICEAGEDVFNYPHGESVSGGALLGNPMDPGIDLIMDSNGVVVQFRGGSRRAEDLLLANVHSFDVKVWDEPLGLFMDVGHDTAGGDFNQSEKNKNDVYGPGGATGNKVFDTWHPGLTINGDSLPPFRPEDDDGNGKPLQAIQITIQFLDVSSGQLRQVTLQHSLTGD